MVGLQLNTNKHLFWKQVKYVCGGLSSHQEQGGPPPVQPAAGVAEGLEL